nr:TolC family outer membrane protein [Microbulbifer celer]
MRSAGIHTPVRNSLLVLLLSMSSVCAIAQGEAESLEVISQDQLLGDPSDDSSVVSGPTVTAAAASSSGWKVDITEAVQRAVSWHPAIGESVSVLSQQKQNIRSARAGYFPQLSMNVVGGYDSEKKGNGDGHALQLYVSQVIYDFGKISGSVDSATAVANASRARVLQQIDSVALDTAQAAIEVQRYQAQLESADEQIVGVSEISRLVRMRNEKGVSSRSDLLQSQARVESARATRQQIQAQLSRWQSVLQNLMGVQHPVTLSMTVPPNLTSGCMVEPSQVNASPAVMVAEAERAAAVAQLKEARAASWPTLSLDGSVNRYLDQEYVDTYALDENEKAIFLNLSMPIYQGGRISADKDAASYAMRSAAAAKDNARLSVERELRVAQSQTSGLQRSLSILDARLDAIAETRRLYQKQYSSLGTRTLVELLNSEQELHQARMEKLNTRFDLYTLQVDCLYTVGEIRNAFHLEGRPIQGVEVLP